MKNKNRNKNERLILLSWLLFAPPIFLAVFFCFSLIVYGMDSCKKIIIQEIYPFKEESIEIVNTDGCSCELSGWSVTDNLGFDPDDEILKDKEWDYHRVFFPEDRIMEAGEIYVLTENMYLNDGDDIVKLFDPSRDKIQEIEYKKAKKESSYSYIKGNWSWVKPATLGFKNEQGDADDEDVIVTKDTDVTLRINEIFPNPSQKGEENEFIEIYNYGKEAVSLKEVILRDRNKKECPLDAFANSLESGKYLVVENKKNSKCKITVHNSKGEFELCVKNNCDKSLIYKISFSESAKVDVSFNFYNEEKWRWSKFLTPGKENIFNNLPEEKKTSIPKEVYTNMYADFVAKVSDADGDKVKVTWDFGDGHKSYLAKTRHKYEKQGKYKGSLKISDGSEDVIKEFSIEVEDYPERKVRIVAINANPVGKDTEGESITVLNKSKKKINFNDWSVATGANSKKLSNHPIKEDFEIKAGKTGEITRDICALTLNNKKGMVELRYPDGEVAHYVKYKKENKDTIKEGEIYEKKGGKWAWIANKPASTRGDDRSSTRGGQLTTDNLQQGNEDLQPMIESIQENMGSGILPEEIGGQSADLSLRPKPIEIVFANVPLEEKVLGAETSRIRNVYDIDGAYHFNNQTVEQPHYIITFLENIIKSTNSTINTLLNKI